MQVPLAQVVGPVQPLPPHCAYIASAVPLDTPVAAGAEEVTAGTEALAVGSSSSQSSPSSAGPEVAVEVALDEEMTLTTEGTALEEVVAGSSSSQSSPSSAGAEVVVGAAAVEEVLAGLTTEVIIVVGTAEETGAADDKIGAADDVGATEEDATADEDATGAAEPDPMVKSMQDS